MRPVIEKLIQKKLIQKIKVRQGSDVIDFFASFGEAIAVGNQEVIQKCWAIPSYILSDAANTNLNSTAALDDHFMQIRRGFTTVGVVSLRPEVLNQEWLTDQILIVTLQWSQLDKNHNEIGQETAVYTLKADNNGKLKIHILTQGINKAFNLYF